MKSNFRARKMAAVLTKISVGILVFGVVVMLLWNALMPDIFRLPPINYWQALGLLVLAKILFSGFFRGGPGGGWRRDAIRDKWANMTPEQREKFKQEWGHRCGRPFPEERFGSGTTGGQPGESEQKS